MQKLLRYTITLLLAAIPLFAASQTPDAVAQLEFLMESLIENLEEGTDATLIAEDLEYFAENPLNINDAGSDQLSKLHLLNEIQIQKLLDYRNEFGPVYSIYELNSIDGFNPALLTKMKPFIWFGPEKKVPQKVSDMLKYGRHAILLRALGTTQKQRGYLEKDDGTIPYEGNRARYYARYRFRAGENISAGFTAEKDPGEAFFAGTNKSGFDFYSGHISMKISPVIEKATIGDFIVRSGQGLVIWHGFTTGKSVYALDVYKTNQGIRAFTSTDENRYFRGAATTLNLAGTRLELFYSQKKNDANLALTDSSETYFTSLQNSGYHRTKNETADKNSVRDVNMGLVASRQMKNLKIGITFLHRQFELPFIRNDQLYNRFRFQGSRNFVAGADYLFSKGKYQFFGETAVSKSKGKAFLQGALAHLHDRFQFAALFRSFGKNYHAMWATPFAKGSSASNETGLYLGARILPVKFVTLSAYSDFYHSEWINFTTAGPSNGWELLFQANFRFSEKYEFYIRYKNEEKDHKSTKEKRNINHLKQLRKIRIHFQVQPTEIIKMKTRMEHVSYKKHKTENGLLVFQDVQVSPVRIPMNLSARIAWFNTESYNSRIYAYENDLLYSFSIPAFFGTGFRTYLNLKYKISDKLEMWFKWANSLLMNAETTGSGYNEIQGNKKTELKIQLRLKI